MAESRQSTGGAVPPVVTRRRALQLARAKWGVRAFVRGNRRALTAEGRAQAHAALRAHKTAMPIRSPDQSDADYQAARRAFRRMDNRLFEQAMNYPCEVGYVVYGVAAMIKGSGDTWAEACINAELLPLAGKNSRP
jgi:hypothetical protein